MAVFSVDTWTHSTITNTHIHLQEYWSHILSADCKECQPRNKLFKRCCVFPVCVCVCLCVWIRLSVQTGIISRPVTGCHGALVTALDSEEMWSSESVVLFPAHLLIWQVCITTNWDTAQLAEMIVRHREMKGPAGNTHAKLSLVRRHFAEILQ